MTQDCSEEPLGRPSSGDRFWNRVELSTDDLWYYVTTNHSHHEEKKRRYYLLTDVKELAELIRETSDFFWIECVMLVTPPRINGTGSWQIYRLKELTAVADRADIISTGYICIIENGAWCATSDLSELNAKSFHQIVFSEEMHVFPSDAVRE
ncbi:hypothetical protein OM427_29675 [Halomonas sp. 18H]|nr:hypothetical protein [Halomonas sp. 18H]MCW4153682.1 hypothetical protein [Halomonas sp. 18H]